MGLLTQLICRAITTRKVPRGVLFVVRLLGAVVPVCGMPLNSAATSLAPGRPFARLPTAAWLFGRPPPLPPPLSTTARTMTTATTATIPPAIASVRGEAWRARVPPLDWTGGGVRCAVRRCSLLFFPLGTGRKGSWLLGSPCRGEA